MRYPRVFRLFRVHLGTLVLLTAGLSLTIGCNFIERSSEYDEGANSNICHFGFPVVCARSLRWESAKLNVEGSFSEFHVFTTKRMIRVDGMLALFNVTVCFLVACLALVLARALRKCPMEVQEPAKDPEGTRPEIHWITLASVLIVSAGFVTANLVLAEHRGLTGQIQFTQGWPCSFQNYSPERIGYFVLTAFAADLVIGVGGIAMIGCAVEAVARRANKARGK